MKAVVDQLFNNRYWMKVEERAFHSEEDIQEIGIMGVNSIEEAESVLSSFRTIRTTIVDLAYYYDRNFKLQFVNPNDVHEIFSIIDQHLNNWLTICNRVGYVPTIPPIEDFEKLDNLAEKLYPFAKKESALSKWGNAMSNIFKVKDNQSTTGFYDRYSPRLYEYCAMVYGEG